MGKQVDKNDFWFIENNPITKVGVYPYLGKQISQDCEPDKIYYVLRPKEELFRKETLDSLRLIPLIDGHTMIGKNLDAKTMFMAPEDKGIDGIMGDNVSHDTDTIYNDLKIISNKMKEEIKNGKKELSLGYFCRYDKQPGTYKGQRYDYVQRDIIANHLALVDKGRMGADVRVYDSKDIPEGEVFAMDSIDITMDKEFNESDVNRDDRGRFATKGHTESSKPKEIKNINAVWDNIIYPYTRDKGKKMEDMIKSIKNPTAEKIAETINNSGFNMHNMDNWKPNPAENDEKNGYISLIAHKASGSPMKIRIRTSKDNYMKIKNNYTIGEIPYLKKEIPNAEKKLKKIIEECSDSPEEIAEAIEKSNLTYVKGWRPAVTSNPKTIELVANVVGGVASIDITKNSKEAEDMAFDDEDIEWITVRGTHIPIKKGESKEQAVKKFLEGKKQSSGSKAEPEQARKISQKEKRMFKNGNYYDGSPEQKELIEEDIKHDKYRLDLESNTHLKKIANLQKEIKRVEQEKYPDPDEIDSLQRQITETNKKYKKRIANYKERIAELEKAHKEWYGQDSMEYKTIQGEGKMADKKEKVAIDEDKRKLIDEIGGILKDEGLDDEIIRTVIGKAEKIAYNKSEAGDEGEEVEEEVNEEETVEEGKDKKAAKDKCGKDEDKDEEAKKKEFVKEFAKKEKLAKEVEDALGTFDHSEMTELEVAKYACDKLELGAVEGQELATLKGYLKGIAKAPKATFGYKRTVAADNGIQTEDAEFEKFANKGE